MYMAIMEECRPIVMPSGIRGEGDLAAEYGTLDRFLSEMRRNLLTVGIIKPRADDSKSPAMVLHDVARGAQGGMRGLEVLVFLRSPSSMMQAQCVLQSTENMFSWVTEVKKGQENDRESRMVLRYRSSLHLEPYVRCCGLEKLY